MNVQKLEAKMLIQTNHGVTYPVVGVTVKPQCELIGDENGETGSKKASTTNDGGTEQLGVNGDTQT